MHHRLYAFVAVLAPVAAGAPALADSSESPPAPDLAQYVDPMVGTMSPGFVAPAASTPFGMTQVSPLGDARQRLSRAGLADAPRAAQGRDPGTADEPDTKHLVGKHGVRRTATAVGFAARRVRLPLVSASAE